MAKQKHPSDEQDMERVFADLDQAEKLMHAVEEALKSNHLSIEDLTVAGSAGGTIALSGMAKTENDKLRADKIARGVPGVLEVLNAIMVAE
jgi:osmotically-inducible protein OsmY